MSFVAQPHTHTHTHTHTHSHIHARAHAHTGFLSSMVRLAVANFRSNPITCYHAPNAGVFMMVDSGVSACPTCDLGQWIPSARFYFHSKWIFDTSYSLSSSTQCTDCVAGDHGALDSGRRTCVPCLPGSTTLAPGAVSVDACECQVWNGFQVAVSLPLSLSCSLPPPLPPSLAPSLDLQRPSSVSRTLMCVYECPARAWVEQCNAGQRQQSPRRPAGKVCLSQGHQIC